MGATWPLIDSFAKRIQKGWTEWKEATRHDAWTDGGDEAPTGIHSLGKTKGPLKSSTYRASLSADELRILPYYCSCFTGESAFAVLASQEHPEPFLTLLDLLAVSGVVYEAVIEKRNISGVPQDVETIAMTYTPLGALTVKLWEAIRGEQRKDLLISICRSLDSGSMCSVRLFVERMLKSLPISGAMFQEILAPLMTQCHVDVSIMGELAVVLELLQCCAIEDPTWSLVPVLFEFLRQSEVHTSKEEGIADDDEDGKHNTAGTRDQCMVCSIDVAPQVNFLRPDGVDTPGGHDPVEYCQHQALLFMSGLLKSGTESRANVPFDIELLVRLVKG